MYYNMINVIIILTYCNIKKKKTNLHIKIIAILKTIIFYICDGRNYHLLAISVEQQCVCHLFKKRNTEYYCKNNFFDLVILLYYKLLYFNLLLKNNNNFSVIKNIIFNLFLC